MDAIFVINASIYIYNTCIIHDTINISEWTSEKWEKLNEQKLHANWTQNACDCNQCTPWIGGVNIINASVYVYNTCIFHDTINNSE